MTIPEAPTTQPVTIEGTSYDVPTEFLCPITLSIMEYPMMTRGGLNYDREAILSWLATHGTCPLTRQPMTPRNLVSNHPLKNKIVVWKREHLGADSRTKSADKELRDLFTAAAFVDVSAEKQTEILHRTPGSRPTTCGGGPRGAVNHEDDVIFHCRKKLALVF